jgi:ABC-type multidrug transport system ATPase subunit
MLKIIELEKRIGDFQLNVKDLFLEEKKIHGIIGNNGSGKSTLIKLMAGRQKLSLARALIFKPKVVFIDETMANMDPDSVVLFEQIIL